jgi:hypothetical protein
MISISGRALPLVPGSHGCLSAISRESLAWRVFRRAVQDLSVATPAVCYNFVSVSDSITFNIRARPLAFAALILVSFFSGCSWMPNGSSMDHEEAEKLSDSYMSHLVADRVDLALDQMEPEFLLMAGGKTKAEAGLRELFNYCGRPLESELRHEDTGFYVYADGRKAPVRGFYYSGRTTQQPKGVCFFTVRIVPGKNGMNVVSFGSQKLLTGQLPDWAR